MSTWRRSLTGWLFVLPALALLGILLVYPALWTIALSFDSGRGLKFERFVGLENYQLLFQDRFFLDLSSFPPSGAVINNLQWVVIFTTLCVSLGLLIAVLADRVRYESIIKAIVFVPMGISATALALIWLFIYAPDTNIGLLNAILSAINPNFEPIAWIGRIDTVNISVIIAAVWGSVGFSMVVLSAALKGIPPEVNEAARVDGANDWQLFSRVTLPMLSLPISVVSVTLIINVIKVFDIIYIMTAGGPRGASRVIAYFMFRETFDAGKGGYGAAVAVVMLLLITPIMIYNVRRFRREGLIR